MDSSRVALGLSLLLCLSVLSMVSVPVSAVEQVIGSPDIDVYSPDNRLSPGEETSLDVYVSNAGDLRQPGPAEYVERVTTARALSIEALDRNHPFEITTGRYPVGNVPQGTTDPIPISLTIPETVNPGTYQIPVQLRYAYTSIVNYDTGGSPEYVDRTANRVVHLEVRIVDRARFEIANTTSTTKIGGHGDTTLTITNVGSQPARDATVAVSTASDELTYGSQSTSAQAFSSQWEPGASREFQFNTRFTDDATRRAYPLSASVTYLDTAGVSRTSESLTAGVTPLPAQTFEIENLSSGLFVGELGHIQGSIRNTGPTAVDEAVISVDTSNPRLEAIERDSSIGDLSRNERADFSFDIRVDGAAAAKTNQLNLSVRYENPSTDRPETAFLSPTIDINQERDWLSVVPQTTRFGVDTENHFRLRIENVESQRLRDIQARLETRAPFESEAPQAFITELGPSESVTRTVGLTVGEDAVPTDAAVSVNVSATRVDGETIHLDTYQIPITVDAESTTSDTTLFALGALVVVLLLVGGLWWMNR